MNGIRQLTSGHQSHRSSDRKCKEFLYELIEAVCVEELVPTEWKKSEIVSKYKQKGTCHFGIWELSQNQAAGTFDEDIEEY